MSSCRIELYRHGRVIATRSQLQNVGLRHVRDNILRHHDIVDARGIQSASATIEPRVLPLVPVALAPYVDETLRSEQFIQLGACARMRFLGPQPRISIDRRRRDVPVAGDHYATTLPQFGAEIDHLRLEAALELMPVACDAARIVVIGLRRAVDRVDVHDRKAGPLDDNDAALAIPLRHVRTPATANECRDAVHASTAKRDVTRIARKGMVATIAGKRRLQRAHLILIACPDAQFLKAHDVG